MHDKRAYHCRACRKRNQFDIWLYAHWRELVELTCAHCGAINELFMGSARLVRAGNLLPPTPVTKERHD